MLLSFLAVILRCQNLASAIKPAFGAYTVCHNKISTITTFNQGRSAQAHVYSLSSAGSGFGCFRSWYCHITNLAIK